MTATRRLHQFVPTLDPGAVGTHLLTAQQVLRDAGWESEVFSEHTRPPYEGRARSFTEYGDTYPGHDDDVLVYHGAIGSSVADFLIDRRPRRLVVDYHNITPPEWFEGWEPGLSYGLAWGRAQLGRLARSARVGLADSAFNAAELRAFGFRHTEVLPILVDIHALAGGADPSANALAGAAARSGAQWLFVGRLAPNKCQHDLVKAFALYQRVYDREAHLWLVGANSSDRYADAVAAFGSDLGIGEHVTLTGAVSQQALSERYATADVFVCLSEHEGFLVPLLESWAHRLPVVAYSATAVPETLGGAGVLLTDKSPTTVAATVARVITDARTRQALVNAGMQRLQHFALGRTSARLLELAEALASGMADRSGTLRR